MIVSWGDERLPERFWKKTTPEPNTGCWIWDNRSMLVFAGGLDRSHRNVQAHRVAYQTFVGPITNGVRIEQTCGLDCCVNPAHLHLETTRRERLKRGRVGMRFFSLLVVERVLVGKQTGWRCSCDCGGEVTLTGHQLDYGAYKSCGCRGNQKHNWSGTPTYGSWQAMRTRCGHANAPNYNLYGGRGIRVCDRWSKFVAFLEDMGPRPDGTSLDRIDPNGNYEPGNCRWADKHTQIANRRCSLDYIRRHIDEAIERAQEGDAFAELIKLRDCLVGPEAQ